MIKRPYSSDGCKWARKTSHRQGVGFILPQRPLPCRATIAPWDTSFLSINNSDRLALLLGELGHVPHVLT